MCAHGKGNGNSAKLGNGMDSGIEDTLEKKVLKRRKLLERGHGSK